MECFEKDMDLATPVRRRMGLMTMLACIGLMAAAGCGAERGSSPTSSPVSPTSTPERSTGAVPPSGSGDPGAGAWRPGPEAPVPLIEQATTVHDGRIWTAGGLDASGAAVDRVAILDTATGAWADGPVLPDRRHHAALVSDGEDLWLIGGYVGDSFEQPSETVYRLPGGDPAAAWVPGPPLPDERAAGAAVWDGSRIVYAGGVGPGLLSNLVFVLGQDGFAPVARLSQAREHLAAATDGAGRSWFLGGRQGGLATNVSRVDLLESDQVKELGELSLARGGVAAFYWPSLGACLSGGEAPSEAYRDVECVTADGEKTSLPPLAKPRHGHGAAVVDGLAYAVFGGHVPALSVSSTVEVFALP
jgi:hypothetical protein